MQLGMIGLGRMGANMVCRVQRRGHPCVVYDRNPAAVVALQGDGATGTASLEEFVRALDPPRVVWLMLPAAVVDATLAQFSVLLAPDDIVVDGGNSYYHDDLQRAVRLNERGIHYVDVGVSGGIWGLERGYCLMIGGEEAVVMRLAPLFAALAPGRDAAPRTPGREQLGGTAEQGYLHCGPHGAGHFVKMVHNGIEYGIMAAYAEGLNILAQADAGTHPRTPDAETTPLRHPEHYQYAFNIRDVTELWRRGSVIGSWLLDLTAQMLLQDPELAGFAGHVADSGEGRWTVAAAIDEGVPVPVISAALFARFSSRGQDDYAEKVLSAMRFGFGGHVEPPTGE